ncbi:MAG: methyltransferase [Acidobacteria bacterium]|nr:MAG: methyltransferase [Acidobacteriota bacterium]
MSFDHSNKSRLTCRDLARFPDDTLLHHIGRVIAAVECLPRKELFESWEMARRIRRRLRGGRVVDLACGHGLLAMILLILDDSSPCALAVDTRVPENSARLLSAVEAAWPRLVGRIQFEERSIDEVDLRSSDLIVSAHACGSLTDRILERAIAVHAPVAVLPCCHAEARCDPGGLGGWLDTALAIDVTRATRLRRHGYRIHTHSIPGDITPKNRLLLGEPLKHDNCQGSDGRR